MSLWKKAGCQTESKALEKLIREVGGNRRRFGDGKELAKRQVRLLWARGTAELGKVASGFATQDLWLGDRKVGSWVMGKG